MALVGPCVRHSSGRGWRQTLLGLRLQTCLDHCVMVSPASPVVTSGSSQIWGWTHFAWLESYQMMVIDHDIFQCWLLVDIIGGNLNIPLVRIGFTIVCYTYLHLIIFPTAHVSAFSGKCVFLVQEATLPDHKRFCNSSANLTHTHINRWLYFAKRWSFHRTMEIIFLNRYITVKWVI